HPWRNPRCRRHERDICVGAGAVSPYAGEYSYHKMRATLAAGGLCTASGKEGFPMANKKSKKPKGEAPSDPGKKDGRTPVAVKQTGDEIAPPTAKLSRKFYEEELGKLQFELVRLQYWVKETGQKLVLIFEGRDAAGKGGTIKCLTEPLNPRGVRLVA